MPYKILSLDGGGSWALIQARVLLDMYGDLNGQALLRKFDMVIANSGGSMVLMALASNLKLSQIVSIFTNGDDRKMVFSHLHFLEGPALLGALRLAHLGPRYSADRKKEGLRAVLQKYTGKKDLIVEQPMSQLPKIIGPGCPELIVCGYNYFTERESFFRSNPFSKTDDFSSNKWDVSLLDAVHASSNAPLNYFDEPAVIHTGLVGTNLATRAWYWDGAIGGFNNPVMAGVVEAMTNGHGRTADDFQILSIGTSTGRRPIIVGWDSGTPDQQDIYQQNKDNPLVKAKEEFGFTGDISKIATSILADPPDSATFVAYSMLQPTLEQGACIVRINPCINPVMKNKKYVIPDAWTKGADSFTTLLDMDMDAVKDEEVALITELCDRFIVNDAGKPALPNQYIRGDNTQKRFLGYGTYREAKAKWLSTVMEAVA